MGNLWRREEILDEMEDGIGGTKEGIVTNWVVREVFRMKIEVANR